MVIRMLKPPELESERPYGLWSPRGCDVWDAISAAAAGDAEALRRLLERDPNLYRAEYWYTQPIHFAVREGHPAAVRVLLEAGAVSTPLAWAARNDLPDMVELLLARGAATNLPDDEPWATPLAWATRRGHGRIAEILRRAGATA